ncbi:MAG: PAS domain-containing protein, partial [Paludibacter sp.]
RKKAEGELNGTNQMLTTVLDNFPGVVFWKDRQSRYLGCNKTFANGAGLNNSSEIVGKSDAEFPTFAKNADKYRADDFEVMESEKAKLHMIDMRHQSDGKTIWLNTSKFPLLDSQGQVIGVIGISNDITKLKVTEQELIRTNDKLNAQNEEIEKRSEELIIANRELAFRNEEIEKRSQQLTRSKKLLEDTERVAKLGGWEFDVVSNKLTWSDMVYSMHELEPDYKPTIESAMSFYSPESFSKITKVVDEILIKGIPYDLDLELITAKKNRIWVRSIANASWKNGKIIKVGGMLHDITERKQSEIALCNSKQELRNFAAHLQSVREEDKIAISREIHDDLGQILVALKIDLGLYKMREIKGDENVTSKLAKLDQVTLLVDRTIKTTRRIMTGLRPEIIDSMGFINASKAYIL